MGYRCRWSPPRRRPGPLARPAAPADTPEAPATPAATPAAAATLAAVTPEAPVAEPETPAPQAAPETPAPASVREWTVQPGESLWRIVQDTYGVSDDAEIAPLVNLVFESNRDQLSDPSVLNVGTLLRLPALSF